MRRRSIIQLAAGAIIPSAAMAFPDKPITLVTGYAPGGSTDIAARILTNKLADTIGDGARFVVENRPGASGTVASDWFRRQPNDGHFLMLAESSSHAIAPSAVSGGTRYNPVSDFSQIGIIGTAPLVLVVNKNIPGSTAQEVLSTLKSAPRDSKNYATSGIGSIPHLACEMLGLALDTRFVHVPYRSGSQMLQAIFTGEADFGIAVLASAAAQIRQEMVRPVAITDTKRFASFPSIPTLIEAGIPDFDLVTWNILLAPPGMTSDVQDRLNGALKGTISDRSVAARLIDAGTTPWISSNTPSECREFLIREVSKFKDIVARTGVILEQ
jgi:tripartite-type tricarboxylate transporter receptor subunit TctC